MLTDHSKPIRVAVLEDIDRRNFLFADIVEERGRPDSASVSLGRSRAHSSTLSCGRCRGDPFRFALLFHVVEVFRNFAAQSAEAVNVKPNTNYTEIGLPDQRNLHLCDIPATPTHPAGRPPDRGLRAAGR